MKGDFSRIVDLQAADRLVLKQQGRVDLDADWNEAVRILDHLRGAQATDTIGAAGVPRRVAGGEGFRITISGSAVTVHGGRMYVDGIPCTLDADIAFGAQPDHPGAPAPADLAGSTWVFYLDVWDRHVTAVSDPALYDPALSGLDTTTRVRTVWQVKVVSTDVALTPQTAASVLPPRIGGGRLTASLVPGPAAAEPCGPMAAGGYTGLENRLYRVEVHHPGDRPGTTAAEGATPHRAHLLRAGSSSAAVQLAGARESGPWLAGQPVEIAGGGVSGRGYGVIESAAVSGEDVLLTLRDVADLPPPGSVEVYRIATFKWSRDNGSVAFGVESYAPSAVTTARIVVASLGRDEELTLREGDVVELLDRDRELRGEPGLLARVARDGVVRATREVTVEGDFTTSPALAGLASGERPRVIRWDQADPDRLSVPATAAPIPLENGLQVSLGGNGFRTGDHWTFAVRPAVHRLAPGQASLALLSSAPPQGIEHHHALLALATGRGGAVTDLRRLFPALTDIHARDVAFDVNGCDFTASTVEQALWALCKSKDLRFHNKHLHGWGVVNGLQVHCLELGEIPDVPAGSAHVPVAGECVAVEAGYAITPTGADVEIRARTTVDLRAALLEAGLIGAGAEAPLPDVEIHMVLGEDGRPRLVPYRPRGRWDLLDGTVWRETYDHCILPIINFFKQQVTETSGDLVGPAQKRLVALLNLFAQLAYPAASHVFLSGLPSSAPERDPDGYPQGDDREDKILYDLFMGLRGLLRSETFCAMFDDVVFPAYDFVDEAQAEEVGRPETVFVKGFHSSRIRANPDGDRVYTIGTGDTINEVSVPDRRMIAELKYPIPGAWVQDVAFAAGGGIMYVVALSGDQRQDTSFAVAIRGLDGSYTFQTPVSTICDLQIVTLAVAALMPDRVLGIAKGRGLYKIDPAAPERPTPIGMAGYAIGHLVLDERYDRTDAYWTAAKKGDNGTSTYDRVYCTNVSTSQHERVFDVPPGSDDLVLIPGLNAAAVVADAGKAGVGGAKYLHVFSTQGITTLDVALGSNTDMRLAHVPPKGYPDQSRFVFVVMEDLCEMRVVELAYDLSSYAEGGDFPLVGELTDDRHPLQLGPCAITVASRGDRFAVLEWVSNTVTLTPTGRASVVDRGRLGLYRVQAINAFLSIVGRFLQYLKDCFCERLLVDPPHDEGSRLYLGAIRVKDGRVHRICNFDRRKYVHSFPTVEYWMSLIPILPVLRLGAEKFCCSILTSYFQGKLLPEPRPKPDITHGAPMQPPDFAAGESTSLFQPSTARRAKEHLHALNPRRQITAAVTRTAGIGTTAKVLAAGALRKPPVIDARLKAPARAPDDALLGASKEKAVELASERSWNVDRVLPVEEWKEPPITRKLFGPEKLGAGGVVDLYVDEKGTVRHVKTVSAAEAESRRLDAELRAAKADAESARSAVDYIDELAPTVGALSERLALREAELSEARARLDTLQKQAEDDRARAAVLELQLTQARTSAADELGSLRARLSEVEQVNTQFTDALKEVKKLKSDLGSLGEAVSKLQKP